MFVPIYLSLVASVAIFTFTRGWLQANRAAGDVARWVRPARCRYELYTEPLAFLFIVDPADQTGLSVMLITQVANLLARLGIPFRVCDFREDESLSREYGFPTVPVLVCLAGGVPRGHVRAEQYAKHLPFDRILAFVKRMAEEWGGCSRQPLSSGQSA